MAFSNVTGVLSTAAITTELERLVKRGEVVDFEYLGHEYLLLLENSLQEMTPREVSSFIFSRKESQ